MGATIKNLAQPVKGKGAGCGLPQPVWHSPPALRHETKASLEEADEKLHELRHHAEHLIVRASALLRQSRLHLTKAPGKIEQLVWRERGDQRTRHSFMTEDILAELVPREHHAEISLLERHRIVINHGLATTTSTIEKGERYIAALHRVDALVRHNIEGS